MGQNSSTTMRETFTQITDLWGVQCFIQNFPVCDFFVIRYLVKTNNFILLLLYINLEDGGLSFSHCSIFIAAKS